MAAMASCVFQRRDGMWAARYIHNGKRKHIYNIDKDEAVQKRQETIDEINRAEFIGTGTVADRTSRGESAANHSTTDNKDESNVNNATDGSLNTGDAGEAGLPAGKPAVTVGGWFSEWLDTYVKPFKGESTYTNYAALVKGHIIPVMGGAKLQDLSQAMLQEFFNEKTVTGRLDGKPGGMSPQSLENLWFMLKSAMKKAVESELISENPATYLTIEKAVRKGARVLSMEEEIKLTAACGKANNLSAFGIIIALKMGLTLSELFELKWVCINWDKSQISLLKTGRVFNENDMPEKFISDLAFYRHRQKLLLGDIPDTVITSSAGKPIAPGNYNKLFKRILDIADIPQANFDILRYTFALRYLEKGHSFEELRRILGCVENSKSLLKIKRIIKSQKA